VPTARGPQWRLRTTKPDAPRDLVRLLPSFDEYIIGWKDRSFVAAPERWRRIHPGAGWFHPAVVADGRGVGTWKAVRRPKATRIEIMPFARLSPAVRRGLEDEVRALGEFLRVPTEMVVARP